MFMGADDLIENNIFQHIVSPMITNGSGSGSVWAYNFAVDDYYIPWKPPRVWQMSANVLHAAGSEMMLFEGNDSTGLISDFIHGTHHFITSFRNQADDPRPPVYRHAVFQPCRQRPREAGVPHPL